MTLRGVEYVVFDEADRLFEMGFADQLKQVGRACGGAGGRVDGQPACSASACVVHKGQGCSVRIRACAALCPLHALYPAPPCAAPDLSS